MEFSRCKLLLLKRPLKNICYALYLKRKKCHVIPFFDLYHSVTGEHLSLEYLPKLKKKHPNIDTLTPAMLKNTIQIIAKFGITPLDACQNPHIFTMNPITMDNYGEILKECGFFKISPKHIIKYHTLVRSRTIAMLKKEGLIPNNLLLKEKLLGYFPSLPHVEEFSEIHKEDESSILSVRLKVLEAYLKWRLNITHEDFVKYCRNYLPLKHKPMSDIQEAIDYAENEMEMSLEIIKRNGFIISSDPVKTKMIVENIEQIAGLDIREAIRLEPAILKNNYDAITEIKDIMKEFGISDAFQKKYLRVYCMCPKTVRERLSELTTLKEYQLLSTNQRMLWMVVHKTKMMKRLQKIQDSAKQCYSLNHLVASNKTFNSYINSFGNRACSRDMATLICYSLNLMNHVPEKTDTSNVNARELSLNLRARLKTREPEIISHIRKQLKRHQYWLHISLNVIHENIIQLQKYFKNDVILNNCHILLYPVSEILCYLEHIMQIRNRSDTSKYSESHIGSSSDNLNYGHLTDEQILSLILYHIERKHHFTGDGIWGKNEPQKVNHQISV